MNPAGTETRSRARITAALVAGVVLGACLGAYVALPAPTATHHAQWISIGRAEVPVVAVPAVPPSLLPAAARVRPIVSETLRAATSETPEEPYRKAPGPARAPPAPFPSIV